jgi:sugar phosphate isomerase/epimerase
MDHAEKPRNTPSYIREDNMKIGIRSTAYCEEVKDCASGMMRARRHGYDGVDFQNFTDTLLNSGARDFETMLRYAKTMAEQNDLTIYQAHAPGRYPPQDATDADRAERFETMAKALYGCAVMGCPYMVVHPVLPYGTKVNVNPNGVWEINRDFFARLTEKAREYGVTLCYENMPFKVFPFSTPEFVRKMVQEIEDPHFRACLDTGHAALFGEPADAVRLLGKDYLHVLHVHDNDGQKDGHFIPYTGVIDWSAFCDALREIGYDGYLSLECRVRGNYPPELLEYYQIGLAKIARTLSKAAE